MDIIQTVKNRYEIIGRDPMLNRAIEVALKIAPTDLAVLITGENGVGKDNFSKIIHDYSTRAKKRYIAVNCGAIPEGTVDSELFGHEKGSFTGAVETHQGFFETLDGGTIFLDEIAELPLSTQAKLLRVLESKEFMRMGSTEVRKTDVRVIAATNRDLPKVINQGKFREDLYYRLCGINIHIPPLRERKDDIYLLFRKFAADTAEQYRMPDEISLTPEAQQLLRNFYWSGNIRQLKHITEQISVLETDNRVITADVLRQYLPYEEMISTPAVITHKDDTPMTERELLYKIILPMKEEIENLKKLMSGMMQQGATTQVGTTPINTSFIVSPNGKTGNVEITQTAPHQQPNLSNKNNAQDTDFESINKEEKEKILSIEEKTKEMIMESLARNNGKRKRVAAELQISERTLYRKLHEYGLA